MTKNKEATAPAQTCTNEAQTSSIQESLSAFLSESLETFTERAELYVTSHLSDEVLLKYSKFLAQQASDIQGKFEVHIESINQNPAYFLKYQLKESPNTETMDKAENALLELAKELYHADYYKNILSLLNAPISTHTGINANELLQVTVKIVDYFKKKFSVKSENYYPFDFDGAETCFSEIRDCLINPMTYVKWSESEPGFAKNVTLAFERYYGYLYNEITEYMPEIKRADYEKQKKEYEGLSADVLNSRVGSDRLKSLQELKKELQIDGND